MKRTASRNLKLLLALCLVMIMVLAVLSGGSDNVEILFLDTSDIHGQLFATDYTADVGQSGKYRQGLTRVATYIKEQRAGYDNVFLSDSGDIVQGTPLTYYYAFYKGNVEAPAVKALRSLGYDLWVVGNHEFNYGMETLERQLDYAAQEKTESEEQLWVSTANYLDAATNSDDSKDWSAWRGHEPYRIYDYDGVKVAVMGIGNPNIAQWEAAANWEGIYFANPIETYLHYEAEMDAASDLIVLVSHSGIDTEADSDFIRRLVEQTGTVDLVFSGHEHRNGVTEITNARGRAIPVLSPYTKCGVIARALITFNKATKEYTIAAETVDMQDYALDEGLVKVLQPYEDAIWNEYMLQSIGTATDDFSASGLATAPSPFMDLINRVQLWGAYDNTGLNTPNDPTDDKPAQLSIAAPLTADGVEELIPEGDIKLGDLFGLYRYEDWLYQINMSGKEIRTWLEYSASKLDYDENGRLIVNDRLAYYHVVYGDGFSYDIDVSAAPGSRIVAMTYGGAEVKDDDMFTVVMNNYCYNGGGNYIDYLNTHGCDFTPNDESRIVYSTQFDMVQGEDMGQARNLLAEYIRQAGAIDPTITSTWRIVNNKAP